MSKRKTMLQGPGPRNPKPTKYRKPKTHAQAERIEHAAERIERAIEKLRPFAPSSWRVLYFGPMPEDDPF